MNFKRFAVALALLVCGSANAATIFARTDGNINFLNFGPGSIDFTQPGTLLGMFNVGDLGNGTNSAVVLNGSRPSSALAEFTPLSPNWRVDIRPKAGSSTSFDNLTLLGSNRFILGLSLDGGSNWTPDDGVSALGGDMYYVNFTGRKVLAVDVQVVPLPAALWLFGSGLLGMIAIARRRSA